ncbi:hypothetical protein D6850_14150 [Roseovarius spongiae]|uniref:Uncharacterized protein n=1 Tax=Roseovarius spongiae TaxID=2320272 RepID=A0A3A8ASK9_9RHOB|nr:hypothetical protein [Roseovarius spongiae]RKF13439.1 hypothetical protein D6850_14150 [Roseovarius spongiae]
MQLVLHAGAHNTDEDKLVKCLINNQAMLAERGTSVPHPTAYRKLMRDILHAGMDGDTTSETRDIVIDALMPEDECERLVLSNHGFFGTPKMAASGGEFYSAAGARIEALREIFAGDEIEIFMGLCNPATFLPALLQQTQFDSIDSYLNGADPAGMRWSDLVGRMRAAAPDIPITIWCNEDTPLIFGQILREMAALEPTVPIEGEYLLLRQIMSKPGMARFESYLAQHPDMTEIQKRRVIVAFLDKFAEEDAIEQELDLPGWTEELVDQLTDLYDEDVYAIARIPGITLIAP